MLRSPRRFEWGGVGRRGAAMLLGWLLAGCASPPALAPTRDAGLAGEQVRVHGARGPLAPAQARRVLLRLEQESPGDLLERHLRDVDKIVQAPLRVGNGAQLLVDGPATHAAMFEAMERARDHINLETYIIESDEVGLRTGELLIRKRRAGVQVNLIYDSVGSMNTPREYFERLRDGGIGVCEYNPVNPLRARGDWRINNRDHRKILVVDGRVAFTGGINISSVYSSGSFSRRRPKSPVESGWRDTHIEARGPVVADMQKLFLDTWREQCGAVAQAGYFPRLERQGKTLMRVIAGEPGESEIYPSLLSAIQRAQYRAYFTVGYFVPDPRTLAALKEAAGRGVDVRLALPGVSDFWAPLHAGRSHYEELLGAGVRVYERHDALLHAKTAVIDGVWSTVGSTNVDWRSFVHNAEANLVVLGEDFGERMEALFQLDTERSVEISAQAWNGRGVGPRMKEWFARQWEYFL